MTSTETEHSPVACPECKGTGEHYYGRPPDEHVADCENCDGTGEIGPESIYYEFALEYWQEDQP